MMKPYSHRSASRRENICSYRFSRGRRTVENAFGILANRFRCFLSPIDLEPAKVKKKCLLVYVCIISFLEENRLAYAPADAFNTENILTGTVEQGNWHEDPPLLRLQSIPRGISATAKEVRETFCSFFNEEGAVPWQDCRVM